MIHTILFSIIIVFAGCTPSPGVKESTNDNIQSTFNKNHSSNDTIIRPIIKTDVEWKKELSEMQYYVLRKKGTERAFSGEYWDNKNEGTYRCSACALPLFLSNTKFKSGTGWPSFYSPYEASHVLEIEDNKFGMSRTEIECARCKGHLGHVFNDGPKPTGLRYCINSASLFFDRK